jgi:lipoprotein Spr
MTSRFVQTLCLLLLLSSCKSLRLASKETAHSSTVSKKKNAEFLDGISMTPGEQKNSGYAYTKPVQPGSKKSVDNSPASSFNIEKADWLLVKYAIMIDMPVEQLNNLALLQQIDHWWGTRYCMGGTGENCIDCSAFTQTMLRNVYGVDIPRTAKEQYDFSTHIDDTELKEGDLVFFRTGKYISHVGMYIANYKFVHASSSGGVTISDLNDSYWSKKYAGAGRVTTLLNPARQVKK